MADLMRASGLVADKTCSTRPIIVSGAASPWAQELRSSISSPLLANNNTTAHVVGVLNKLRDGLMSLGDGTTVSVPVVLTLLSTMAASVEKLSAVRPPEEEAFATRIREEQFRQLQHELQQQQQISAALSFQLAESKHMHERQIERLRQRLGSTEGRGNQRGGGGARPGGTGRGAGGRGGPGRGRC